MPVTEKLMAAGDWNVALSPDTPLATRNLCDYFGHVFTFDAPPPPGLSDATMIALARWGGVVRIKKTAYDIGGANMITWLGDEDGKGPIIETAVTLAANNLLQWLTALVPVGVHIGTIAAIGSLSSSYQWVTPRQAIDNVIQILGAEYRVNKDGTIDADVATTLFRSSPTAIATRRSSGEGDPALAAISTTKLDVSIDAEEYITRQLVQDSGGAWTGANGSAVPYKDLFGNTLKMTKATVSSLTPNSGAAALAANLVSAGQSLRQAVDLESNEYDIDRDVAVGDWIWVYAPEKNLLDTTNQVQYRGETIFPTKVRVLSMTWPIERGMAVWYRDLSGVWTDLTSFVVFEQPGVTFEVGAVHRQLLTKP